MNRISNINQNQSGDVAFFVKNCLDYEVDISFNKCDVDDLLINVDFGNSKFVIIVFKFIFKEYTISEIKMYIRSI